MRTSSTVMTVGHGWPRREWLTVGALGSAGLCASQLLGARSLAGMQPVTTSGLPGFGRARSCIVCFLFGAPAHQDIWDLKPEAPSEVRGPFRPIATNVPGIQLGEHVPQIAAITSRFALIRSVEHPDNTHTVAMHFMLTGHRHIRPATNPQNAPSDFPTFGAVLQHLGADTSPLPRGVSLNSPANQVSANNHIFPGFFAGFLGQKFDPLFVSGDPSRDDFQAFPDSSAAGTDRLTARGDLHLQLARTASPRPDDAAMRTYQDSYRRAFDLITSAATKSAFELGNEPEPLRDRYGRNSFGQGCLLARRLVEAGVPLVTVNWARDDAYWDTHKDNFHLLQKDLLPPFDAGFSALLDDLADRGLLEETLVVCFGEFGRTPKINAAAGRDHWAGCNSVVLAGAGIRGGQVIGASDKIAAQPIARPITPGDLAATIYHALGIEIRHVLRDALQRPYVLTTGQPVVELWGS